MNALCPCGSDRAYAVCCQPLHQGAPAASAEALMRSRYAAHALGLSDYLLSSWHPSTRPAEYALESGLKWLGLAVKSQLQSDGDHALVEFVARYREGGGSAQRLRERSRFLREGGHWYYLDGEY